jgi:copper chaperone CopZ
MKKLFVAIASLLVLQAGAQFKQATLQASGLTCAMCSNAINKALQKLTFAEKVQSNIKESSFTITFKPGAAVDFDAIRKSVEGAGFSMANLKVRANFDGVAISNDAHFIMNGRNLHFLDVKQQTLKGEQTIQVVDKKFVSEKVYKKYVASTKMECIKTGIMQSCCAKDGKATGGARVYHVTI